jgi:hypothetical protein
MSILPFDVIFVTYLPTIHKLRQQTVASMQ